MGDAEAAERLKAERAVRSLLIAAGALAAAMAVGYFFQMQWALDSWPWVDGRLSNIFISSVLGAVAAAMLWVGISGRLAAATAGFVHVATMLIGFATVLLPLAIDRDDSQLLAYAVACLAAAAVSLGGFAWARRRVPARPEALPRSLKIWSALYVLITIPVGSVMILNAADVMPWPIKEETETLYGWIFVAASCSFIYPLLRGGMEYVIGGLVGFLAYDIVLIVPFLGHLDEVPAGLKGNLILYITALVVTASVSIYYLFIRQVPPAARPEG